MMKSFSDVSHDIIGSSSDFNLLDEGIEEIVAPLLDFSSPYIFITTRYFII